MADSSFVSLFTSSKVILGEGAVIERLHRETELELDSHVVNSGFIYTDEKRFALESILQQYMRIGAQFDLPLLVSTPTWRASLERIEAAGLIGQDVNGDNFSFLARLRSGYGAYGKKIIICGLMSCRGDAYKPQEALSTTAAREFHAWQAGKLANTKVDFLLAATLPALSEATGLAQVMAKTKKPYIISFVLRAEGTLLDGTPLKDALEQLDASVAPKPLAYLANCTHTSIFKKAINNPVNSSPLVRERMVGLLANTASLSPEQLDMSTELIEEPAEVFGREMSQLYVKYGMKVLGGCCGTNDHHIYQLALKLCEEV